MVISAAKGLALARIAFGLYFLQHAWSKTTAGYLTSGQPLVQFLQQPLAHSTGFYHDFLVGVVLPHATLFSILVTLAEWVAGVSLTLGLLTRVGAVTGMWLTLNYMLMKGPFNSASLIDELFFVSCLAFLLAGAGLVWGLDGALQDSLGRYSLVRWLAGSRSAPGRRPETAAPA